MLLSPTEVGRRGICADAGQQARLREGVKVAPGDYVGVDLERRGRDDIPADTVDSVK